MRQTRPCPNCGHIAGFYTKGKATMKISRTPSGDILNVAVVDGKYGRDAYCVRCCAEITGTITPEQRPQEHAGPLIDRIDFATVKTKA